VVAGVDLTASPWRGDLDLIGPLLAARVLGKAIGIFAACAVVVRLGGSRLPRSNTWEQMAGTSLLCDIGFTVPLLFAERAFGGDPVRLAATKVALLVASVLCAAAGLLMLRRVLPGRGSQR
jgi:NhaA family Na+:H+ antiporter